MNLNSGPKNSPMCQIRAWSSYYLENNSSFFVFSTQKMTWHTGNKRLLWQHLTAMVIDKIRKMSVKGVKSKSESFFSVSPGVLELWRKNLRGVDSAPPPGPDRVKFQIQFSLKNLNAVENIFTKLKWTLRLKKDNMILYSFNVTLA